MREVVLRAVGNVNPAFAKRGRKNACACVDRNHLLRVSNIRAHIFYAFKLSHAVSGLSSAKHGSPVGDLMRDGDNVSNVDLFILAVSGWKTKNPRFEFGRRDYCGRVENDLTVYVLAFWEKSVNVVTPVQRTRTKVFVQVGPNLQVDDAVKSAVIVLWVKRFAVVHHLEKAMIFWQALKHYIVALICEMLCYWQAPRNVSEPQMVNN